MRLSQAMFGLSTGKRRDVDAGSDSSDCIIASPSDNMAIVRVTSDNAVGIGFKRNARPHKIRPYYKGCTAPAKGLRPGSFE